MILLTKHQYLERTPMGDFLKRYGHDEKIGFLDNEEFTTVTCQNRIEPDANSPALSCKIYVLISGG